MHIKKIHLEDYKRFHDLTIDLGENPARIIALVGPNGCGKSSVFDGMLYKSNAFGSIGYGSSNSNDYKYHSLMQDPGYSIDNISICFIEGEFNEVRNKQLQKGLEKTIFSFRSSFRYNGRLDVQQSSSVTEIRKNDYGATTSSDIDERIEQNYKRLKIKFDRYLYSQDCSPSIAKKHIIGELNQAITNCLSLQIDNLGNIEEGKGTIFFRKDDTETAFSFNVLSSGEKEVVDILLDLYLRKDEYTDSIYIIDEPELHINTSIQKKLLIEIDRMIPDNCQIWIATHSIGFLRALQEELQETSQVIMFGADNNWASESYVLRPIPKSRTSWQTLFQTALDDLTTLVAPKQIVYCEGKDYPNKNGEEQGLDAIVFNNIFGSNYPDTLFVSSGGNTELDQRSAIAIAVLSKALPNTDILVLKDRDMASGKETNEDIRQQYLKNNPDNHRVLRRFEIENYLYDKEVLHSYCEEYNTVFDENEYDSFVTDIANQNLKDKTGRIKNICGITTSINPEIFKINLSRCFDDKMKVYKELEQEIFNRK